MHTVENLSSSRNDGNTMLVAVPLTAKPQIEHFFKEFTRLANSFWNDGDMVLYNYWKGQAMGMSKVVNQIGLDIDTDYWLKQIP